MTRRPLLLSVLMVAASGFLACSAPALRAPAHQATTCSDRVAQALSSPDALVPGALACMSASMQEGAKSAGVSGDADFQKIAASDPAFTSYRLLGVTAAGGVVYVLEGATAAQVLEMTVDSDGKVATIDGLHPDPIKH